MTHTAICESKAENKRETHIKSNHCEMTHATICELNVINKKKPIFYIIIAKWLTQPSES